MTVSQAVDAEKFRGVLCFDRATGKQLWKAGVTYAKPERSHRDNPYCSASPATDGEHVGARPQLLDQDSRLSAAGLLRRGPFVIMPPPFSCVCGIPIGTANVSDK